MMKTSIKKIIVGAFFACLLMLSVSCQTIEEEDYEYFNQVYHSVFDEMSFENVINDFSLPTEVNDTLVSYSSSNSEVISVDGGNFKVTRGTATSIVNIDVLLTKGNRTLKYVVTMIVPKVADEAPAEPDMVESCWNELYNELFACVEADGTVEKDINMITKVTFNRYPRFTWTSSRPGIISEKGRVLKPLSGNENVKLSATLRIPKAVLGTKNDHIETKDFTFTVLKYDIPYDEVKDFEVSDVSNVTLLQQEIDAKGQINQFPAPEVPGGDSSVNIIVIPVEFTDDVFTAVELEKIGKAFFGTREDTGWESLMSYYNKSSYGRVSINGTVTTVYNTGMTVAEFEQNAVYQGRCYLDYVALDEGLKAKIDELSNFQQYDGNNDGLIDGIYLVYSARQQDSETDEKQPYWNGNYPPYWTYHNVYDKTKYELGDISYLVGGKEYRPYGYVWYSYENINENTEELQININSEILVHESGRFFGLPYFYNYAWGPETKNKLGYMDMMYSNIGDHGPWSKMVLGWIKPQIVTESTIVKISSAPNSGQVVLVSPKWENSYFSEYLLIDFYTPAGLYELQASHTTGIPVFTNIGVRIYHIRAELSSMFNPGRNVYTSGSLVDYITGNGEAVPADSYLTDAALFVPGSPYDWSSFEWSSAKYSENKDEVLIRVLDMSLEDDYAIISIDLF